MHHIFSLREAEVVVKYVNANDILDLITRNFKFCKAAIFTFSSIYAMNATYLSEGPVFKHLYSFYFFPY